MIEQEMSMTAASMFWLDSLHDYDFNRSLSLPFDHYRLSEQHRTGRGISISFDLSQDVFHHLLTYSSLNKITMEELLLATYYTFLFKLTNGEKDLCIGMNTSGRYKEELMSLIGMFVNAIPLRCQLDPCWSFHHLVYYVQQLLMNSLKYSYYPLQRILARHSSVSKIGFLETSFDFQSYHSMDCDSEVMVGDARLRLMPISIDISDDEIMSKFDFVLSIQHDLDHDKLSCSFNASLDLFDRTTVSQIAQRFHWMLEQTFNVEESLIKRPIYEISLTLSDEKFLMKSINNTEILFPSFTCIHHEIINQAMQHSQKISVELDDQLLTYSELLYYSQLLSLILLNEENVEVGEIICQCVERSISMVSMERLKHNVVCIEKAYKLL